MKNRRGHAKKVVRSRKNSKASVDAQTVQKACQPLDAMFGIRSAAMAGELLAQGIASAYNASRFDREPGTYQAGQRGWQSACPELMYFIEAYWNRTGCRGTPTRETNTYFFTQKASTDSETVVGQIARLWSGRARMLHAFGLDIPPLVDLMFMKSLEYPLCRSLTLIGTEDFAFGPGVSMEESFRRRIAIATDLNLANVSPTKALNVLYELYASPNSQVKAGATTVAYHIDGEERRPVYAGKREIEEVRACIEVLSHLSLCCTELLVHKGLSSKLADATWSWAVRGLFTKAILDAREDQPVSTRQVESKADLPPEGSITIGEMETRFRVAASTISTAFGSSRESIEYQRFEWLWDFAAYLLARIECFGYSGTGAGILRQCACSLYQGFERGGTPKAAESKGLSFCNESAFVWRPSDLLRGRGRSQPTQYCPKCSKADSRGNQTEVETHKKRRVRDGKLLSHAYLADLEDLNPAPISELLRAGGIAEEVIDRIIGSARADRSAS